MQWIANLLKVAVQVPLLLPSAWCDSLWGCTWWVVYGRCSKLCRCTSPVCINVTKARGWPLPLCLILPLQYECWHQHQYKRGDSLKAERREGAQTFVNTLCVQLQLATFSNSVKDKERQLKMSVHWRDNARFGSYLPEDKIICNIRVNCCCHVYPLFRKGCLSNNNKLAHHASFDCGTPACYLIGIWDQKWLIVSYKNCRTDHSGTQVIMIQLNNKSIYRPNPSISNSHSGVAL